MKFNKPTEVLNVTYTPDFEDDNELRAWLCYYRDEECIRVLQPCDLGPEYALYIPEEDWLSPEYGVTPYIWAELKQEVAESGNDITMLLFG